MTTSDDDFVQRWSRRKVDAREGLARTTPVKQPGRMNTDMPVAITPDGAEAEAGDAQDANPVDEFREAALQPEIAESELEIDNETAASDGEEDAPQSFEDVDFDALTYESDFTRFMKAGVPEAIRRRALRQLWLSDPVLANLDGLNDYDEDFTDAKLVVEFLQTSHKVGQGYLTDEEMAAQRGDGEDGDVDAAEREVAEAAVEDDGTRVPEGEAPDGTAEDGDEIVAEPAEDEANHVDNVKRVADDDFDDGDLDPA